jgi:hypothetical protein
MDRNHISGYLELWVEGGNQVENNIREVLGVIEILHILNTVVVT